MKLLKKLFSNLQLAIAQDLLEWLEQRALVLPSGVRDKIARDFGVERQVVDALELRLRKQLTQALREWLQGR